MNSMKRALDYKLKDTGKSILKFWIVIILLDIFSVFMNFKYGDSSTFYIGISNYSQGISRNSILGVNILPILIFFIATAYENYYNDFPRFLNFSMTRKNLFKANLISNISIAFIFAFIQSALMKIDPIIVERVGKIPLYEFNLFNLATDTWIFIFGSLFITFLTFVSLWQLIASLNYKFGAYIWIGFLIIFVIGNNVIINSYSLFDLILPGDWLNMEIDLSRLLIYTLFIILTHGIIYLTNKTIDIVK